MRVTAAPNIPQFAGFRIKPHKPEHIPPENSPPTPPVQPEDEEEHEMPPAAISSRGYLMDLRA